MTGAGVVVAGQTFRLRPFTGRLAGQLTRLQQTIEDHEDTVAGLEVELRHLGDRIDALGQQPGEFDREARDRLNRERRELRGQQADAQDAATMVKLELLLARCEPVEGVTLEWCLDHVTMPGDFNRILQQDAEVPPTGPAVSGEDS